MYQNFYLPTESRTFKTSELTFENKQIDKLSDELNLIAQNSIFTPLEESIPPLFEEKFYTLITIKKPLRPPIILS